MTRNQTKIYNWLLNKPGFLKKGKISFYNYYKNKIDNTVSNNDIDIALKQARIDSKQLKTKIDTTTPRPAMRPLNTVKKYNPDNVIFIPDLHAPFIRKGVLEFCKEMQHKYDCGTVIFAGDIVDGHAWSYHEHDPDGMSVGHELQAAREQLKPWFKAFPNAISLMGNHDLLIQRKARTIGLSKEFIKGFGDVIGAPKTWEFKLEHLKDNVLYKHGNVGNAFKVAQQSRISTCQGHFHAETSVQWSVSEKDAIFGLQVGWGADRDAYAFDYGKPFAKKPIISCGLILDRGQTPIVKLMNL